MNKSMWFFLAVLTVGAACLGGVLGYFSSSSLHSLPPETGTAVVSMKDTPQSTLADDKSTIIQPVAVQPAPDKELSDEVLPPEVTVELDAYAIESMADARINGDDRAPPIGTSVEAESATAEELASPDLYLEYEARQEKKIYKAYIEAARAKTEQLEALIIKAKEQGMSEDEVEVGLEKIKRINKMKAQLLLENPDLGVE